METVESNTNRRRRNDWDPLTRSKCLVKKYIGYESEYVGAIIIK